MSRGQAGSIDRLMLNSFADQRPRSGKSMPRIVEASDTFIFHIVPKKKV
jgi:hypothetical protein